MTIDSAVTPGLFHALRTTWPSLQRFSTARDLLSYLAEDLSADLDVKDAIYSDLVRSARQGGPVSRLAHSLLWVGLWPGLSAAFARRVWFWQDCPDELVAEMTTAFTMLVARIDFARVKRVVGTLIRSTERDVVRASVRRAKDRTVRHNHDDRRLAGELDGPPNDSDLAGIGPFLRAELARVLRGKEDDLVTQAVVLGHGAAHFTAALQLKPAAARKRLERARKRLRAALADARIGSQVSHTSAEARL